MCVCVVMSCVWCAYSCSEVRRLLGQVQGFSPLCLCCHSWNNWLDYRHLACFTPAFHSKAAFSSTLACFFFTTLHWDVKEQEMQKSLAALMCVELHLYISSKRTVHNCAKQDKCFLYLFCFLYVCFDIHYQKWHTCCFFSYVLYSYAGLHLSLKWQHGENVSYEFSFY